MLTRARPSKPVCASASTRRRVYAPLVKWSTTIDARSVRQQLRRAMRMATGAPPGPVHFELPQSETTREAGALLAEPPLRPNLVWPRPERSDLKPAHWPHRVAPSDRSCSPASASLGARGRRLRCALCRAPRRARADDIEMQRCRSRKTTPCARAASSAGLIERNLVNQADLIITVGLDAVELQPKPWPYTLPVLALSGVAEP